jgi:hypothetical protein
MKAETIDDIVHRAPFKPVEIVMDNGQKFLVKHPDYFFFTPSKKVGIVTTEDDRVHIIDLEHVSSIHTKSK